MRKIVAYITILILALSCKSQYYNDSVFCGSFGGREGAIHSRNPIAFYVSLELNADHTFLLERSFDMIHFSGRGEWALLNDGVVELNCNNNPVLSDVQKALMAGGLIEGTVEIRVLSKDKLKWDDTVLRRKK